MGHLAQLLILCVIAGCANGKGFDQPTAMEGSDYLSAHLITNQAKFEEMVREFEQFPLWIGVWIAPQLPNGLHVTAKVDGEYLSWVESYNSVTSLMDLMRETHTSHIMRDGPVQLISSNNPEFKDGRLTAFFAFDPTRSQDWPNCLSEEVDGSSDYTCILPINRDWSIRYSKVEIVE